jgi:SAM-dependent methyltransferase
VEPTQASGVFLPFRNEAFSAVVSISVLEHIRNDSQVIKELVRVIKDRGVLVISVPISPMGGFTADALFGIPHWYYNVFGKTHIQKIMKMLGVDRGTSYFERFYSREDLLKRLLLPSQCVLEEFTIYWDWKGANLLQKVFPKGVFTPSEFLMANAFLNGSHEANSLGGIIFKLRKDSATSLAQKLASFNKEYAI